MPTRSPLEDTDQNSRYNPADTHYRETMGAGHISSGIDQTEAFANDPENSSAKVVDGAEKKAGGDSSEGGLYRPSEGGKKEAKESFSVKGLFKKKGPIGAIIGMVLGGGGLAALIFSPGLLIVQMKETMVDAFNVQLPTMDARYGKIIRAKVSSATAGFCSSNISIKCRYATMSDKQVAKFKAAGITIEPETPTNGKRTKPTGFRMADGTVVTAENFSREYSKNQTFRKAVRQAYNPKFAGFADKTWTKVAKTLGVKKSMKLQGATPEEKAQDMGDKARGQGSGSRTVRLATATSIDPDTGRPFSEGSDSRLASFNADLEANAQRVSADIDGKANTGNQAAGILAKGVNEGTSSALRSIGGVLSITGIADSACQAYGAIRTLGYAAKTIRAAQLARYAFVFLNTADQIKEGTATPEDVAFAGSILTELAIDTGGAATDSYGYKHAAYGDSGPMKAYSMRFLAGGGLTGDLIAVTTAINNTLGGNAKTTCATLANPWVQAGSIVAGIGLMLVPFAGQGITATKIIAQGAVGLAFSVAMAVIPSLLQDVVAGTVTDGLKGADAGDAYASGSGGLFGSVANAGGGAPMSKEDGLAFLSAHEETVALYNADEASDLSPFDPSNRNTFIGGIVFNLLPYTSSVNTAGSVLTNLGTIFRSSIQSITPKTSALTAEQKEKSLQVCTDSDYVDMGIATDPFCNVIYGIPPRYLDKDPFLVIDELGDQLSASDKPKGAYADFIKQCIDRTEPLGNLTKEDDASTDGAKCIINDDNANYYLHYVDSRINEGLDGFDSKEEVAVELTGRPDDTIDRGKGWTLKDGVDYSGYQCDSRTTDEGTYTIPGAGYTVRKCRLPFSGQNPVVASVISADFMNMAEAASAAGITFVVADGLRIGGSSFSQHTRGIAVDLGSTQNGGYSFCWTDGIDLARAAQCRTQQDAAGDAVRWLDANAINYGFMNLQGEAWHWSVGES